MHWKSFLSSEIIHNNPPLSQHTLLNFFREGPYLYSTLHGDFCIYSSKVTGEVDVKSKAQVRTNIFLQCTRIFLPDMIWRVSVFYTYNLYICIVCGAWLVYEGHYSLYFQVYCMREMVCCNKTRGYQVFRHSELGTKSFIRYPLSLFFTRRSFLSVTVMLCRVRVTTWFCSVYCLSNSSQYGWDLY